MNKYRVVTFDGGGIRGVITAVLLKRLSEIPQLKDWLEKTEFFAGTSTGGLIALALAKGMKVDEIVSLYQDEGDKIFNDSIGDDIKDIGKLLGADYDIANLRSALEGKFGSGTTLGDLSKKVLVTAFDLQNDKVHPPNPWKPKIFHNFPGADSDSKELVYKVGCYTSAAPTYFPSEEGFIDGGIFAPNPSMCALAQTQDSRNTSPILFSDIRLISFGTGRRPQSIPGMKHDWGIAQWAPHLVNLIMEGMQEIAHFQCMNLLGANYHRPPLNFPGGVDFAMDDVEKVDEMVDFANSVDIDSTVDWLTNNW